MYIEWGGWGGGRCRSQQLRSSPSGGFRTEGHISIYTREKFCLNFNKKKIGGRRNKKIEILGFCTSSNFDRLFCCAISPGHAGHVPPSHLSQIVVVGVYFYWIFICCCCCYFLTFFFYYYLFLCIVIACWSHRHDFFGFGSPISSSFFLCCWSIHSNWGLPSSSIKKKYLQTWNQTGLIFLVNETSATSSERKIVGIGASNFPLALVWIGLEQFNLLLPYLPGFAAQFPISVDGTLPETLCRWSLIRKGTKEEEE